MKRKYKSSEDWKMFGFEPTITEVTGKPEAAMISNLNGHWFPIHVLQDFVEAERDRDAAENKLANAPVEITQKCSWILTSPGEYKTECSHFRDNDQSMFWTYCPDCGRIIEKTESRSESIDVEDI